MMTKLFMAFHCFCAHAAIAPIPDARKTSHAAMSITESVTMSLTFSSRTDGRQNLKYDVSSERNVHAATAVMANDSKPSENPRTAASYNLDADAMRASMRPKIR